VNLHADGAAFFCQRNGFNTLSAVLHAYVWKRVADIAAFAAALHEPAWESQIGAKKIGVLFSDRL